jgi:hypothetical protein
VFGGQLFVHPPSVEHSAFGLMPSHGSPAGQGEADAA